MCQKNLGILLIEQFSKIDVKIMSEFVNENCDFGCQSECIRGVKLLAHIFEHCDGSCGY